MMGAGSPPSWASGVSADRDRTSSFTWAPQLQQAQPQTHTQPELDFAEPSLGTFEFPQTQSAQDAEYASNASLPPLESVLELTDAVRPPLRGEEPQLASTSAAGMLLNLIPLCVVLPDPYNLIANVGWCMVLCFVV